MGYTTEELLDAVKRSGLIPSSEVTFTDSDLIAFADSETKNRIVPLIMSNRQNYFLAEKIEDVTANVSRYVIPERSIGGAFKDLFWIASSDNPDDAYPIPQADPHIIKSWTGGAASPGLFYMAGDEVVLVPTPTVTTSQLKWFYYRKPSNLSLTTACAKITSISSSGGFTTFTVDTDLTASLSVGDKVDFNSATSPYLSWADDVVITAITSTTIQVSTSDVDNQVGTVEPQVDDYIAPAKFCNIPQIPEEYHELLAEMIVSRCLKGLGAEKNFAMVEANIKMISDSLARLTANRVEAEVETVFDRNSILSAAQNSAYRFSVR